MKCWITSVNSLQVKAAAKLAECSTPLLLQIVCSPLLLLLQVSIVMEYCNCGTLHDAVMNGLLRSGAGHASTSCSDMAGVLQVALDIAKGMAYMHNRNICHGDLCCKNVLLVTAVGAAGPLGLEAKIGDFGLSRLVPQQNTHLSTLTHGECLLPGCGSAGVMYPVSSMPPFPCCSCCCASSQGCRWVLCNSHR